MKDIRVTSITNKSVIITPIDIQDDVDEHMNNIRMLMEDLEHCNKKLKIYGERSQLLHDDGGYSKYYGRKIDKYVAKITEKTSDIKELSTKIKLIQETRFDHLC